MQNKLFSYLVDGKIKYDDFLKMMAAQSKLPDPQKEILDAFRLSDVEKRGFIMTTEFKRIMTTFGEELPEREGEMLLRQNVLCLNQWGKVQRGTTGTLFLPFISLNEHDEKCFQIFTFLNPKSICKKTGCNPHNCSLRLLPFYTSDPD